MELCSYSEQYAECMNARRPGGVTLVAVLVWISGFLSLLTSVLLLISGPIDWSGNSTVALIAFVVGLLTIFIAGGLLKGNTAARMLISVLQVLTLIGAVGHLALNTVTAINDIISIALAVIVLLILWSKRSNRFFA